MTLFTQIVRNLRCSPYYYNSIDRLCTQHYHKGLAFSLSWLGSLNLKICVSFQRKQESSFGIQTKLHYCAYFLTATILSKQQAVYGPLGAARNFKNINVTSCEITPLVSWWIQQWDTLMNIPQWQGNQFIKVDFFGLQTLSHQQLQSKA